MEKQELRERVWDELEESGEARFPFPPHGRIPNFAGADAVVEQLVETTEWQEADTIKSNPDAPQLPVRRSALRQGKIVYMAVPRLRDERCFLQLHPDEIRDIDHATTVGGSAEVGEQVLPEAMKPIDFIVSGSVAVNTHGSRIGKGEGYSDLEFAILREFGLVNDDTTTATTVHELQVREENIPVSDHDVPIDLVVTPEWDIRTEASETKPPGIAWTELTDERIEEIPILQRLKDQ